MSRFIFGAMPFVMQHLEAAAYFNGG